MPDLNVYEHLDHTDALDQIAECIIYGSLIEWFYHVACCWLLLGLAAIYMGCVLCLDVSLLLSLCLNVAACLFPKCAHRFLSF